MRADFDFLIGVEAAGRDLKQRTAGGGAVLTDHDHRLAVEHRNAGDGAAVLDILTLAHHPVLQHDGVDTVIDDPAIVKALRTGDFLALYLCQNYPLPLELANPAATAARKNTRSLSTGRPIVESGKSDCARRSTAASAPLIWRTS